MDRIKAIEVFIAVCDEKNFSKVAEQLEISSTMVAKYISFLEKEVNVKLFNRSTRGQILTEAGENYLSHARRLAAQHADLLNSMAFFSSMPQGLIKINAPVTYGTYELTPLICEFLQQNPDIRIDLNLTDTLSDVLLDGFDVVFRVGALKDASYISRKVSQQQLVFCASSDYLEHFGTPKCLQELKQHRCLGFKPWNTFSTLKQEFNLEYLHLSDTKLVSNNGNSLRVAAKNGLGIALQSYALLSEDIGDGSLIQILKGYCPSPRPIHMLYSTNKQLPLKTRRFIDFITQKNLN